LPLVPIGAVLAGVATARFRVGGQALLAAGFLVLSFFCVRPRYRASSGELREAGLELKRTTATGSLIVAADYGDPSIFYYAERKGWHFTEREAIYNAHPLDSADAIADLERLRARGATQLVFYSGSFWWLNYYHDFADHLSRTAILREDNPRFRIYDLKTP
jgi:hypothetical protein